MDSRDVSALLGAYWQGELAEGSSTAAICRSLSGRLERIFSPAKLARLQEGRLEEVESALGTALAVDATARELAERLRDDCAAGPAEAGAYRVSINADHNLGNIAARDLHVTGVPPQPHPAAPEPRPSAGRAVRILFLGANPREQTRLFLEQEVREIDQALRQSEHRDRFELKLDLAARISDLPSHLLRHRPQILHFSGHAGEEGLYFEGPSGLGRAVAGASLGRLLAAFKERPRCVVLNACYTEDQAKAVAESIDCVVGTSEKIGSRAATLFSSTFYQALAYGSDVESAFKQACAQLEIMGVPGEDRFRLIARAPIAFVGEF